MSSSALPPLSGGVPPLHSASSLILPTNVMDEDSAKVATDSQSPLDTLSPSSVSSANSLSTASSTSSSPVATLAHPFSGTVVSANSSSVSSVSARAHAHAAIIPIQSKKHVMDSARNDEENEDAMDDDDDDDSDDLDSTPRAKTEVSTPSHSALTTLLTTNPSAAVNTQTHNPAMAVVHPPTVTATIVKTQTDEEESNFTAAALNSSAAAQTYKAYPSLAPASLPLTSSTILPSTTIPSTANAGAAVAAATASGTSSSLAAVPMPAPVLPAASNGLLQVSPGTSPARRSRRSDRLRPAESIGEMIRRIDEYKELKRRGRQRMKDERQLKRMREMNANGTSISMGADGQPVATDLNQVKMEAGGESNDAADENGLALSSSSSASASSASLPHIPAYRAFARATISSYQHKLLSLMQYGLDVQTLRTQYAHFTFRQLKKWVKMGKVGNKNPKPLQLKNKSPFDLDDDDNIAVKEDPFETQYEKIARIQSEAAANANANSNQTNNTNMTANINTANNTSNSSPNKSTGAANGSNNVTTSIPAQVNVNVPANMLPSQIPPIIVNLHVPPMKTHANVASTNQALAKITSAPMLTATANGVNIPVSATQATNTVTTPDGGDQQAQQVASQQQVQWLYSSSMLPVQHMSDPSLATPGSMSDGQSASALAHSYSGGYGNATSLMPASSAGGAMFSDNAAAAAQMMNPYGGAYSQGMYPKSSPNPPTAYYYPSPYSRYGSSSTMQSPLARNTSTIRDANSAYNAPNSQEEFDAQNNAAAASAMNPYGAYDAHYNSFYHKGMYAPNSFPLQTTAPPAAATASASSASSSTVSVSGGRLASLSAAASSMSGLTSAPTPSTSGASSPTASMLANNSGRKKRPSEGSEEEASKRIKVASGATALPAASAASSASSPSGSSLSPGSVTQSITA